MRGAIRLAIIVVSAAAAVSCGSASPTQPSTGTPLPVESAPGALPGLWNGFLMASRCPNGICAPAELIPFVLRVAAQGAGFTGSLEIAEGSQRWLVVDVSGAAQPDGSVSFTGTRGPVVSDQSHVEVRQFVVSVSRESGLTGTVDVRKFFASFTTSIEGRVASAAYRPLVPTFEGRWLGRAVIRRCTGYCPIYQDAGDDDEIRLVIGQSGQALAGQIAVGTSGCVQCWLPVTGRIELGGLTLTSDRIVVSSTDAYQLQSFSGSLDPVGRITGRFTFEGKDRIAISPFDITFTLEYEILWLTREP